jgi:hypothetical protein
MTATIIDLKWLPAMTMVILIAAFAPDMPLSAQGLNSSETIKTIIGSDIQEEESGAKADAGKVIAAMDITRENIRTVRKIFKLDTVNIVFLSDATVAEGGLPPDIEAKAKEHEIDIAELRNQIEGNAMLYHAINSRQILPRDILAVEFDGSNGVVIYAAAKPSG